jgi:hypothetical protein
MGSDKGRESLAAQDDMAATCLGVKWSRVQISLARPNRWTPSNLVGPVFNRLLAAVDTAS